eukprot:CAMPEP_0113258608 /NCGR_PEP_ID=MMETSP0008_2-20120614/15914_1 /TAXON_ID=97485 /ORGANISM="Prymnesium parvum" /LENGTH=301 /DNA_ID=CAMNT_0000107081 /DNA_START=382 /DNA_END=1291 /DNA_ORIENTATION=- /assembly_acc=CAM_ASM_000153
MLQLSAHPLKELLVSSYRGHLLFAPPVELLSLLLDPLLPQAAIFAAAISARFCRSSALQDLRVMQLLQNACTTFATTSSGEKKIFTCATGNSPMRVLSTSNVRALRQVPSERAVAGSPSRLKHFSRRQLAPQQQLFGAWVVETPASWKGAEAAASAEARLDPTRRDVCGLQRLPPRRGRGVTDTPPEACAGALHALRAVLGRLPLSGIGRPAWRARRVPISEDGAYTGTGSLRGLSKLLACSAADVGDVIHASTARGADVGDGIHASTARGDFVTLGLANTFGLLHLFSASVLLLGVRMEV